MYETYYGFAQRPFSLVPDPDFLFLTRKHGAALACLEYALFDGTGFAVITGEIGCGKTTLIRHLLKGWASGVPVALLSQTQLCPEDLLRALCRELGVVPRGDGKPDLLDALSRFLVDRFPKGRPPVLILDEAQNLPAETLEEVRMLSNLDAGDASLLQVILVGQPVLRERLRRPDLQQLAQRVEVTYHLEPLDPAEAVAYIRHRIQTAGGTDPELFDDEALAAIQSHTRGIPRLINALCHMCLVYGMADDLRRIDRGMVETVVREQGLGQPRDGSGLVPAHAGPSEGGSACPRDPASALEALVSRLEALEEALGRATRALEATAQTLSRMTPSRAIRRPRSLRVASQGDGQRSR